MATDKIPMDRKTRIKIIAALIAAGINMAEIGRMLGISRERVRQLARASDLHYIIPNGYVPASSLRPRFTKAHIDIGGLYRKGKLQGMVVGNKLFVSAVSLLELNKCARCGGQRENVNATYCADCAKKQNKESSKRTSWRRLFIQQGQPIPERFRKVKGNGS